MGKPIVQRQVADNTIPTFGTSQPMVQITDKNFPAGDELVAAINLRYKGEFDTTAAAGAPVADGALKILRALTVETNKHGKLIDGVDGLSLHRVNQFESDSKPASADCASNADATTFSAQHRITFYDENRLVRPLDLALDVMKAGITVKRQYGVVTDIQSAGTNPQIINMREDIHVEVQPGPINPGINPDTGARDDDYSMLPALMPVKEVIPVPIVASQNAMRIQLPYGDRIYRRIYISQRTINPANGLVTEVSNIIAENAAVSLKHNYDARVDRVTWGSLSDRNKQDFHFYNAIPTGWACIQFDRSRRIPDMFPVLSKESQNLFLELDVTLQTNAFIVLVLDSLKPIPNAADRRN